jgi:arsenite methyltransferase
VPGKLHCRMMISDLVTDREIDEDSVDPEKWCSRIDGALTKKNCLDSIRKAGFKNIEALEKKYTMTIKWITMAKIQEG